jgi:hypothetical protein
MLAFCTSPSEISLVLGPSDARWLSEEMSFLSELYLSKAGSSERQFGEEGNVALASFLETAAKCQQLSVALQQAVGRGHHASGAGRDQPITVSPATDSPHPVSALPSPEAQSGSAERPARPKRVQRTARGGTAKKKKDAGPRSSS